MFIQVLRRVYGFFWRGPLTRKPQRTLNLGPGTLPVVGPYARKRETFQVCASGELPETWVPMMLGVVGGP